MNRASFLLFLCAAASAQILYAGTQEISADCGNAAARTWWDVQHYELFVNLCHKNALNGKVVITARVTKNPVDSLQLDLKQPLQIDQVQYHGMPLAYSRQGNHYYLHFPFSQMSVSDTFSFTVQYHGLPPVANNPPWESGFIYAKDSSGNPWWAVTCETEGAFVWFPCKNSRSDEADSVTAHYTCDTAYTVVGNGRLKKKEHHRANGTVTWTWVVRNPINNYDITFYLGKYVHWHDQFDGIKGRLDLDYFVLSGHVRQAQKQFAVVKPMLGCFEQKLGPYPFYEDGFKLVESPYLGMEHQSAVAYGNGYQMGYLGTDRSHTGIGLTFDFIIFHESAHEWFGNSISASDKAYSWIQEGFTTYAETIFVECLRGKADAFSYQRGKRANIKNDAPVEGVPGICDGGGVDQYDKAAFLIHMIRVIMANDNRFYDMLRAMNQKFYHQTVTAAEVENWMCNYSGVAIKHLFAQYLHHKELPVLTFKTTSDGKLQYRWENCIETFDMPIKWHHKHNASQSEWLYPTTRWQYLQHGRLTDKAQISKDFLVTIKWQ